MDWKRIIVAIDDSPASVNAVNYVASIIGKLSGAELCLLHVYPTPPPDYYRQGKTLDSYQSDQEEASVPFMDKAVNCLVDAGIDRESISTRCLMANSTISNAILEIQEEKKYGTIVVGKRGISKSEEFLFGSISSALIHHGKDIAIWVVG